MSDNNEYHVASFVSLIDIDHQEDVLHSIRSTPGAEVHVSTEQGKVVFTIEAEHQGTIGLRAERLKLIPGMLSLSPVFHQYIEE